jgi:hypothetical protein
LAATSEEQKWIFSAEGRLNRLERFAGCIAHALNNAITAADSFLSPNPEYPERSNDDLGYYDEPLYLKLFDPVPECVIDRSVSCQTGDEVPWTGRWYPETGLEAHSLAFAIKGLGMQPVFRITKTVEELDRENPDCYFGHLETIAIATTWHPVIPSGRLMYAAARERSKANSIQPALTPCLWLLKNHR